MYRRFTILAVTLVVSTSNAQQSFSPRILRYTTPAKSWEKEALPLGNGRLGCMVFGGVNKERIQFNEDTLWIGDESDTGSYQAFGDVFVNLKGKGPSSQYERSLDIRNSLHVIKYRQGGVNYRREYFASNPANVLVFRFTADQKGAYTGFVRLKSAHKAQTKASVGSLVFEGKLSGKYRKPNKNYAIRLDYECQLRVLNVGGTISVANDTISFKGCDSLIMFLDAGTNYLNQRTKGWKRSHPHKRITARLDKAVSRSYDELYKEHRVDYQRLFGRLSIDLGGSSEKVKSMTTFDRLMAYRRGAEDHDLEELVFQYARYLMISCSREGCMPANLQGLWNASNAPAWRCDYHTDVNIQMNYWFVDQANLSDCFTPYTEYLNSVIPVRRDATKKKYGVRGWMHRSENGIFGGSTYKWIPGDAAWVLQNVWDHYAFTQDKTYLKTRAYPMIKELCEFWEDFLKEDANGKLVSPKSVSPEHGPAAEGNSYEQQLVYDLFTNYIEASKVLNVDAAFRKKVELMRSRLLGPKIGKWGQLQEWAQDRDNKRDHHRHLSHLIAVHPGRQISPITTPKLANAAKVSMNARGDKATGWSKAWKINIWARLHDGNRAYKLIKEQLRGNFFPNLYDFHPPFQMDGNFGYASGVCEMLLQSHMGEFHFLPALPDSWSNGEIKGIKARGNYVVDIKWRNGKLTEATIYGASAPTNVKTRVADAKNSVAIGVDKRIKFVKR